MYVVSGGWWLVCRLNRVNVTWDREQSPASGDEFCFQKRCSWNEIDKIPQNSRKKTGELDSFAELTLILITILDFPMR